MAVLKFAKGDVTQITPSFKAREFDCHCGYCSETLIDDELVAKLQALREKLGVTVHVTSGYRCRAHQDELTAQGYETNPDSQHCLGRAADIQTGKHTGDELDAAARSVGFQSVGIARTWAHCDLRPEQRSWRYKKS